MCERTILESCCPSCDFTDEKFREHAEVMKRYGDTTHKERMFPALYKDPVFSKWVIECQNCGMTVLFYLDIKEETIDYWDALPRKKKGEEG